MANLQFDDVRERAAEVATEDDLRSVYTRLVHENGRHEYYFANDTEETAELREAAAIQLGMLLCVLADRSDSSIAEITEFAVDRGEQMELR